MSARNEARQLAAMGRVHELSALLATAEALEWKEELLNALRAETVRALKDLAHADQE